MSRYILKSKSLDFSSEDFMSVVRNTGVEIVDKIPGHAVLIEATDDAASQLRRSYTDCTIQREATYSLPIPPRHRIQSS